MPNSRGISRFAPTVAHRQHAPNACAGGPRPPADVGLARGAPKPSATAASGHKGSSTAQARLHAQLDAATATRAYGGNAIELIVNGPASWERRMAQVQRACVILVKTYEFLDDPTGRRMVQVLKSRARDGCHVAVQYDYKGTRQFPGYLYSRGVPKVLQPLANEANVTLVPCHMPSGFRNQIFPCDHKKYFITFERGAAAQLIVGGMNIGEGYARGGRPNWDPNVHGYRDTDLLVRGPVVAAAVDDFLFDMRARAPNAVAHIARVVRGVVDKATYASTERHAVARLVTGIPHAKVRPRRLVTTFKTLLNSVPAGQTVLISNAYFIPTGETTRAIVKATLRGVKFKILKNARGVHDTFGKLAAFASHGYIRKLWRKCPPHSLQVYEWHASHGDSLCSIHQKVAMFGEGGPVWVGSANQDGVSANSNYEVVLLVDDPHVRRQFSDMFNADLKRDNVKKLDGAQLWAFAPIRHLAEEFVLATLGRKL